jgi:hypothetical protein
MFARGAILTSIIPLGSSYCSSEKLSQTQSFATSLKTIKIKASTKTDEKIMYNSMIFYLLFHSF